MDIFAKQQWHFAPYSPLPPDMKKLTCLFGLPCFPMAGLNTPTTKGPANFPPI
jgi:hypothetical protein